MIRRSEGGGERGREGRRQEERGGEGRGGEERRGKGRGGEGRGGGGGMSEFYHTVLPL